MRSCREDDLKVLASVCIISLLGACDRACLILVLVHLVTCDLTSESVSACEHTPYGACGAYNQLTSDEKTKAWSEFVNALDFVGAVN